MNKGHFFSSKGLITAIFRVSGEVAISKEQFSMSSMQRLSNISLRNVIGIGSKIQVDEFSFKIISQFF